MDVIETSSLENSVTDEGANEELHVKSLVKMYLESIASSKLKPGLLESVSSNEKWESTFPKAKGFHTVPSQTRNYSISLTPRLPLPWSWGSFLYGDNTKREDTSSSSKQLTMWRNHRLWLQIGGTEPLNSLNMFQNKEKSIFTTRSYESYLDH